MYNSFFSLKNPCNFYYSETLIKMFRLRDFFFFLPTQILVKQTFYVPCWCIRLYYSQRANLQKTVKSKYTAIQYCNILIHKSFQKCLLPGKILVNRFYMYYFGKMKWYFNIIFPQEYICLVSITRIPFSCAYILYYQEKNV